MLGVVDAKGRGAVPMLSLLLSRADVGVHPLRMFHFLVCDCNLQIRFIVVTQRH